MTNSNLVHQAEQALREMPSDATAQKSYVKLFQNSISKT